MYPATYAATAPDRPAVIMGRSGAVVTYLELNDRSIRLARILREAGLQRGDHVALFMENQPRFLEVAWAALRSGLYITTINSYLTVPELAYIVNDCEAKALVTSAAKAEIVAGLSGEHDIPEVATRLMADGTIAGFDSYEDALDASSADPLDDETMGAAMLYSSGTTGRPKGVKRPLPKYKPGDPDPAVLGGKVVYGWGEDTIYLSPAPMYHAAPLAFSLNVQRFGGTVVMMEHFDAAEALALIEREKVTHSQWVPTMFVRMLKLPDDVRLSHDLSTHRVAIHAAAPCPVEVKRRIIEWWGPILLEYYAGTEGNGATFIASEDWLQHPGSVGRVAIGKLHIVDDEGNDLPPNTEGTIYFSGAGEFEYHNAPEKTEGSRLPGGRSTLGDVGYVDDDGYLFLTDRKAYMIISGGVNIYPREIEDVLVTHAKVADVAVFGIPDEDFGEQVKAVVQPIDGVTGSEELARELTAYARERLAGFKVPKSIDFEAELPRLPTGKLYKRILRDRYMGKTSTIV
ncbi:MAG TPA: AMP-binding protein [Acidimicrobiales bacterium]|nr:AMP-binding protein [Acidimicrobiales bacterium]